MTDNADEPVAEVCGINVYAKQAVDGANRWQLERLCRYITRPPVAQDRLTRRGDGMLELAFKRPWKDGSRALILSPDDLLVRLCAAVPPPRVHQVRYFGVQEWAWCRSPYRDRPIRPSNSSDCRSTRSGVLSR